MLRWLGISWLLRNLKYRFELTDHNARPTFTIPPPEFHSSIISTEVFVEFIPNFTPYKLAVRNPLRLI